ncbi:DUF1189 family protein [Viridibacillus arvi]|uniref:4-hydroxy-3-methylbut-2-en-1-yl diphosphate synthase n=1 Tax=Viridibacillus arvi TaxID=263475 RepID=A0A0M0LMD4_9BACL|nr:DUF1189 family protein [Viridibacillus arvi]KOO52156.1 4-hydroxy-3-methylbut-2-en-1-yl diphosphate synthase [Viridibacillus arvi]
MKIKHYQLFLDSILHPKKLAAYRMLPIGKLIQYVFILITFITVVSFIQFLTGVGSSVDTSQLEGLKEYLDDIKWLIYPFAFVLLFTISTFLTFLRISIYGFIGSILLKMMGHRGEYRHIWRTTALATTLSTILTTLLSFTSLNGTVMTLISMVIIVAYIASAITKYPKIKK